MAGRPRSVNNTKVFDVAKPGKSKPMGTSRPVIVSHAVPIKDATVVNVTDGNEKPAVLSPPSVTRKVIVPLNEAPDVAPAAKPVKSSITIISDPSEEEAATAPIVVKSKSSRSKASTEPSANLEPDTSAATDTEEPATAPSPDPSVAEPKTADITTIPVASDAPDAEEPAVTPHKPEKLADPEVATEAEAKTDAPQDTTAETPAEPATPEEAPAEPEPTAEPASDETKDAADSEGSAESDAASVDALAEASEKPKKDQKKAEEEAKKEAALQELIDSKKYVVPLAHDSSKQKSGHGALVALLILIILAAGAYLALDAQLIKTNITLPYHVFKQKQVAVADTPEPQAAPSVTLTQSGLKIPYAASIWSPEPPSTFDAGDSVSLTKDDTTRYTISVTAYEFKNSTASTTPSATTSSTTALVSSQKIPAGGTTDLYFYQNIRSYKLTSDNTTYYQPEVGISADATGFTTNIPITGKDYTLNLSALMINSADSKPVRFTTNAAAQAWFSSSAEFKQVKTLLMGIKY